ncbi:MAG TPA: DNA polymerase III subunit alpha, partial [Bacillota bacterium]
MAEFVHLHQHTEYSLLDGAARVSELARTALAQGSKAMAITDHGSMYGVIDFYKAMKGAGLKPIIGCEVYVSQRTMRDKEPRLDDSPYHLVLLAEDQEGYRNLMRIVSAGHLDGFYYKPRVDHDFLTAHSKGLIALTACLAGELPRLIIDGKAAEARRVAGLYADIFGPDHLYLEIQDHYLEEERRVKAELTAMARAMNLPMVATNDAHYVRRDDARAHEILLCIQTATNVDDPNRLRFPNDEFYLKTPDEMAALFPDHPEALANTLAIAERCEVEFKFGNVKLPNFQVPTGETLETHLRRKCEEGLVRRYGDGGVTADLSQRLGYELSVIDRMGYAGYFLVVADFIEFARSQGIPVGPGRGSAAGSLVAYALGITGIDPLRHGLLFDRFLNPERVDMPDIDIDFCDRRRDRVIDYVVGRYGSDHVAQIITFGTLGAKAAVRDVGRALNLTYAEVDKIAKMIPFALGMTIDRALELNPDLKAGYDNGGPVRDVLDLARAVEGLPRHASIHAAGVVISRDPLVDQVPLQRSPDGQVITQFDMNHLAELGLLKMDFLGLRNLSVIDDALRAIDKNHGARPDLDRIPLDDPKVFKMLAAGDTVGVFQVESSGMTDLLKRMRTDRFEDLVATIALYRPGPMQMIDLYLNRRTGREKIDYIHPALEPILKETHGVMVYQEQVMKVASALAGFTLAQGDLLRRAMGKKKPEVLEAMEKQFLEGCEKNDVPVETAVRVYDLIYQFAGYGFNKSHSAAYAVVAYQTAWLKAHYPGEYMAALLSSVGAGSPRMADYTAECTRLGLTILPPDVNHSGPGFEVDPSGKAVRFGLRAVKNVGEGAAESVVATRQEGGPFRSLRDFCERVDSRVINKRVGESLIKAGAFGSLGIRRSQLMATLDEAVEGAQETQRRRQEGQLSFFDLETDLGEAPGPIAGDDATFAHRQDVLPDLDEFPIPTILAMEKEVLGLYLSGHPLAQYENELRERASTTSTRLAELPEGSPVVIGGLVSATRRVTTRKGEMMLFATLEDLTGAVEVVVFPRIFREARELLERDRAVLITGRTNSVESSARFRGRRGAAAAPSGDEGLSGAPGGPGGPPME